jgi:hypothetical protein
MTMTMASFSPESKVENINQIHRSTGLSGSDRTVVGIKTTYATNAYHH